MAFYSGAQGELWIDGMKAAKVANWSITSNLSTLDTTSLADTDRTTTPGVRSTSGNCTLFYYADANGKNDASTLIRKVVKARTSAAEPGQAAESEAATLKLRVNDGTAGGKHITVQAWLTSIQMQMAVGEVLSAQVSFEANGAPTEAVF
jgi:hypothetical protein